MSKYVTLRQTSKCCSSKIKKQKLFINLSSRVLDAYENYITVK